LGDGKDEIAAILIRQSAEIDQDLSFSGFVERSCNAPFNRF